MSRPIAVFRPRLARLSSIATAAVTLAVCCLLAVVVPHADTANRIGIAGVGVLVAVGALVFGRSRLVADEAGLLVVNLVHSRRLEWAEVVRIEMGANASWASADLSDGTAMPVLAIQAADGRHAEEELAAVQALIERHSAA